MSPGRREVERLRSRLDAVFSRFTDLDEDKLELRADFARYLCVLVSGFLEKAVSELLYEHTRQRSSPTVSRHVGQRLDRFQNASKGRILDLAGSFDHAWRDDLEAFISDEKAAAVGSIVNERHRIAHGEDSTISYVRVKEYREHIDLVVDHIADLVDPQA